MTLAVIAAMALLGACTRRATQLMVVIDSDLPADAYDCISIEVARLTDGMPAATTQWVAFQSPEQASVPLSLGVLPPGGDAAARVEIRVEARRECMDPNVAPPATPPVVRTVTRAGFVSEQTLRLPMFLATSCRNVTCSTGNVCSPEHGGCVPIPEERPEDLMPTRPGEELLDGAVPAMDAHTEQGVCPLTGNDFDLAAGSPRVFGLTAVQPSFDWVVLYDDAGSLHGLRFAYDQSQDFALPTWNVAPGADAIAVEGLASGNVLLALVNPTGSTELVRLVGGIGETPVRTTVGTGRLVQQGRHSTRFGSGIATVVERGAGVAVIAVGPMDASRDVFVSDTAVDIALGSSLNGDLLVAIGGAECEIRSYGVAGNVTGTTTVTPSGATCAPRAVSEIDEGDGPKLALLHGTDFSGRPTIRLWFDNETGGMTLRLDMTDDYASPIGSLLGDDETYRVGWVDLIDYPDVPGSTPLQPGMVYWTALSNLLIGEPVSEYTDHGDETTNHELTRWERLGVRSAMVMTGGDALRFRSICRPTAP